MNFLTGRRSGRFYSVLFWGVTLIGSVTLLALGAYFVRQSMGNSRFEAKVAELQQAGKPVDDASMEATYQGETDNTNTAEWLKVFSEIGQAKKTIQNDGVYGIDRRIYNEPFVAKGVWKFDSANERYLDHFQPIILRIRDLAKARKSVFIPKRFDSYLTKLSELDRVRDAARLLQLDGYMSIRQNKPERVLDDIITLFNLAESFEYEPGLISGLIYLAVDGTAIELIKEALSAKALGKSELAALQTRLLEEANHVPQWTKYLRDERALTIPVFRDPGKYGDEKIKNLPPRGWDGLKYLELMQAADGVTGEDLDKLLAKGKEVDAEVAQMGFGYFPTFETTMTKFIFPSLSLLSQALVKRENQIRLATYATACSAYMLEHGQAPVSLEVLPLPHDRLKLSGGKPPGYRVLANGDIELWYFDLDVDSQTPATPPPVEWPESPEPVSFTWEIPLNADQEASK